MATKKELNAQAQKDISYVLNYTKINENEEQYFTYNGAYIRIKNNGDYKGICEYNFTYKKLVDGRVFKYGFWNNSFCYDKPVDGNKCVDGFYFDKPHSTFQKCGEKEVIYESRCINL